MIAQYQALKAQYSDCLLFFRLGDFYRVSPSSGGSASAQRRPDHDHDPHGAGQAAASAQPPRWRGPASPRASSARRLRAAQARPAS
jgi:hypothetical protein